MSEESDLEKTEAPTPRRLEKAREEGQAARSRELNTFAMLMAAAAGLWMMGPDLLVRLSDLMRRALTLSHADAFDEKVGPLRLAVLGMDALSALLPLLALLALVALISPMALGGWLFSTNALAPQMSRINPLSGIGRMFSSNSLVELGKAIGKAILIGGIAAWVLWRQSEGLFALLANSLPQGINEGMRLIGTSFFMIAGSMLLIAVIDVPAQLLQHARKLRMTRQDVRQEARESDGDPQVKARIRNQQREMARRRMMAEVPKSDVVIVNPTHFAVALRYEAKGSGAPRLVAKGRHLLAARIREVAEEHAVPVLHAPPLARALHAHVDLGDEVPETLYAAVAEVLAYVYQLRSASASQARPLAPTALPVPAHLDPGADPA